MLVKQFFGILARHIEIVRIFFVVGIFITLHRCQLHSNYIDKMIFISKNCLSNPCIVCLKLSNFASASSAQFYPPILYQVILHFSYLFFSC
jgi:hypothetical protein